MNPYQIIKEAIKEVRQLPAYLYRRYSYLWIIPDPNFFGVLSKTKTAQWNTWRLNGQACSVWKIRNICSIWFSDYLPAKYWVRARRHNFRRCNRIARFCFLLFKSGNDYRSFNFTLGNNSWYLCIQIQDVPVYKYRCCLGFYFKKQCCLHSEKRHYVGYRPP